MVGVKAGYQVLRAAVAQVAVVMAVMVREVPAALLALPDKVTMGEAVLAAVALAAAGVQVLREEVVLAVAVKVAMEARA